MLLRLAEAGELDPANIPPDVAKKLPGLVHAARELARPCDPDMLGDHLDMIGALAGHAVNDVKLAQWKTAIAIDYSDIPSHLLIEALEQARRKKSALWDIGPFVQEYTEEDAHYIKKRAENYQKLAALLE